MCFIVIKFGELIFLRAKILYKIFYFRNLLTHSSSTYSNFNNYLYISKAPFPLLILSRESRRKRCGSEVEEEEVTLTMDRERANG